MSKQTNEILKRFETFWVNEIGSDRDNNPSPLYPYSKCQMFLKKELHKLENYTAQECYLQTLAVHCGESECSEAINSKFKLGNE